MWMIRYRGQPQFYVRGFNGLKYIHVLLRHKNASVSFPNFFSLLVRTLPAGRVSGNAGGQGEGEFGQMHSDNFHRGVELIDERRLLEVRRKVQELQEDISEAERDNDLGRVELLVSSKGRDSGISFRRYKYSWASTKGSRVDRAHKKAGLQCNIARSPRWNINQ